MTEIYKTGHAFLGKDFVNDNDYIGVMYALSHPGTITFIKPGTTPEDIIRSLEITIQDVKLRAAQPDNTNKESNSKKGKGSK